MKPLLALFLLSVTAFADDSAKLAALLDGPGDGAIACGVTAWHKGDNAERMVSRAMASAPPDSRRREAGIHYLEIVSDGDGLS